MRTRGSLILSVLLPLLMLCNANAVDVIDIGSRLEPFIDDFLIERADGAKLTLHKPTPREVVLTTDAAWEGNISAYFAIFRDGDRIRMYYRGQGYNEETGAYGKETVCYAESEDGIHFTRPSLGLVEFEGSRDNNIMLTENAHCFAPFKDSNPNCKPDERYKAFARVKGGLRAMKSPDGIHWSPMQDAPVITKGAFDSQNLGFYDNERERYVDFHRGFRKGVRDIMTCTSNDFLSWTDPEWIAYTNVPTEHLYTNAIVAYPRAPHIFMGFPKRFVPKRNPTKHRAGGVSDGVFMTSRDGLTFRRWGEAFIRPGLQKDRWVNRNNMTAWGMLETKSAIPGTPNELSIYASEGYYSGKDSRLRRYTMRLDGFVSMQAPLSGGEFVTRPVSFDKPAGKAELKVNYSTSAAGGLRCELQDANGEAIKGFTLAESDLTIGDAIEQALTWKGKSDLSALAGKAIRVRFVMSDADLYAMRFAQ